VTSQSYLALAPIDENSCGEGRNSGGADFVTKRHCRPGSGRAISAVMSGLVVGGGWPLARPDGSFCGSSMACSDSAWLSCGGGRAGIRGACLLPLDGSCALAAGRQRSRRVLTATASGTCTKPGVVVCLVAPWRVGGWADGPAVVWHARRKRRCGAGGTRTGSDGTILCRRGHGAGCGYAVAAAGGWVHAGRHRARDG